MKNFSKRFRFDGHKKFKLSDVATEWHGAAMTRKDEQEQSKEQAKTLSQLQQQGGKSLAKKQGVSARFPG
jgi:hypothetical protein